MRIKSPLVCGVLITPLNGLYNTGKDAPQMKEPARRFVDKAQAGTSAEYNIPSSQGKKLSGKFFLWQPLYKSQIIYYVK